MVLSTRDLHYRYPYQEPLAFPDVELAAAQAALVLGPSGKGKTTFLHLLAGLLRPSKGTIEVSGTQLPSLSGKKLDQFRGSHIGLVFQKSYFLPYLSLSENINLALHGKKIPPRAVQAMLNELGISKLQHKKPRECSIGEQQRASIARALLAGPALLLADEPTSALDDQNAEAVARLLRQATEKQGLALLIVTHDQRLKSQFPKSYLL